jgi:hypothetical protein
MKERIYAVCMHNWAIPSQPDAQAEHVLFASAKHGVFGKGQQSSVNAINIVS